MIYTLWFHQTWLAGKCPFTEWRFLAFGKSPLSMVHFLYHKPCLITGGVYKWWLFHVYLIVYRFTGGYEILL